MPDVPPQLAEALRDRYGLERELGRGGMATVYLAQDQKHDRPVALKVLHPELASVLGPERFQREIRLAARLQHPHILTVLDSGEAAGQLWFTMPYVEGESLRDRLQREHQLPVEDAVRITREAAQGLQYAHEHDVVHRDVKPENLLLTRDGNTLVADFGIARALGAGDEHLTRTGVSVGTPAYMSPEQASGDHAVDARTDVYSLGCVLYEMLVGEPPFTGPTAQAIIAKRLTEAVPSVRRGRPSVPALVEQVVQRALAPIAADRFATASDLARALQTSMTAPMGSAATMKRRRLPLAAATLVLGILLGLGVLFAWRRSHAGTAEGAVDKVLAVLPFENLGDSADAYFADGMANEVRGRLSRLTGMELIASGSSNEYRHTTKPPQEVARDLGATYLLTGTVQWEKGPGGTSRVRVSPELVEVGPGHPPRTRWQQSFDASISDVFAVQADIATRVASALDVALGDRARQELAAKPTENLAAYDAFLKGEAASQGMSVSDPPSLRRAISYYEQAVALDSAFVPAWARLAGARALLYWNSTPTPRQKAQAWQAAQRAQTLGPSRPEGQHALGEYYSYVDVDHGRALAAYDSGLKLAPNDADLLASVAVSERNTGLWDQALQHLLKAEALDPRSAITARRTASTLLCLRRYPEAWSAEDRAQALAPTSVAIFDEGAMIALAQGDLPRAQSLLRVALRSAPPAEVLAYFANGFDLYWVLDDSLQRQLLTLHPSAWDNDRAVWAIIRAETYYLRGDTRLTRIYADSALRGLDEQLRASPEDAQRHVFRGLALAYLDRKTEAIREGERAVTLMPIARDAFVGAYMQHQVVRIYLAVGEPEKALDLLEPLLRIPGYLSPGWLRIDPNFAPLKGNPRFERLTTLHLVGAGD